MTPIFRIPPVLPRCNEEVKHVLTEYIAFAFIRPLPLSRPLRFSPARISGVFLWPYLPGSRQCARDYRHTLPFPSFRPRRPHLSDGSLTLLHQHFLNLMMHTPNPSATPIIVHEGGAATPAVNSGFALWTPMMTRT